MRFFHPIVFSGLSSGRLLEISDYFFFLLLGKDRPRTESSLACVLDSTTSNHVQIFLFLFYADISIWSIQWTFLCVSSRFSVFCYYYLLVNHKSHVAADTYFKRQILGIWGEYRHVGKYRKISLRHSVRRFSRFCGVAVCGSITQMENSSIFVKDSLQLE